MKRLCKNKITDHIREHFGANPLKIPESRIRPLSLLEIKDNKADFLGALKYLTKNGLPLEPEVKRSKVPDVSGTKTKKIDIKFGFNILDNFLKAFGIDPAVVGLAIKNSKKLSFAFSDVNRIYIEPLQLGQIISDHDVIGNPENIFIKKIIDRKDLTLVLITDVLVSTNFSLSTYQEDEADVEIEIPLIQEYISDMDLKVKVEQTSKNEIKFKGEDQLSFAFSCVELMIDPITGKFSIGDWLKNIRSARGLNMDKASITETDWNKYSKYEIDANKANPLLIEF